MLSNVYEIIVVGNEVVEVKDIFVSGLQEDVVVEKDGVVTYFKVKGKGFCDSYVEDVGIRDILVDLIYDELEGK
jgi:hypothetical protein